MVTALQFEYNSLVLGNGTNYNITSVDGLSPPDVKEDVVAKAVDHGAFTYARYLTERRLTLQGYIIQPSFSSLESQLQALKAAFVPRAGNLPLKFMMPDNVEKRINCKPRRLSHPHNLDYTLGFVEFAIEMLAGDPRIYAEAESTLTGTGTANNAGNFPSFPTATSTGGTTPTWANTTTGQTLTVNSGVGLTVDFLDRTIVRTSNGVSMYHLLDPSSVWWDLEPGNNNISMSSGGTMQLKWRSTWL